jgi:hypothetical protein
MGRRQNQSNRPNSDFGAMRGVIAQSVATKQSGTPLLDRDDCFSRSRDGANATGAAAPW